MAKDPSVAEKGRSRPEDNNQVKEVHKNVLFAPGTLKDDELFLEPAGFAPHPVHKVPTYYLRMLYAGSRQELGAINLRVGNTPHVELYAGHVGYVVHPAYCENRYAARSIRLLIPVARKLG